MKKIFVDDKRNLDEAIKVVIYVFNHIKIV